MNAERAAPSFPLYFPYKPDAAYYFLPKVDTCDSAAPPVPPKETWISEKYGKTPAEYLASGVRDTEQMLDILRRDGIELESLGHILEIRMRRWTNDPLPGTLDGRREIWGTDIDAGRIIWCKQHLCPPFRFLTTTTVPHLPFEDRYFDFAYAGSVFTHIDDLADAWFAELRRVLRVGGTLFVTVHLQNDLAVLERKYPDSGLAKRLRRHPQYAEFASGEFDVFTVERSAASYVFYDLAFLRKSLEPHFRILSVTEEVRLYQNALLLQRTT